MTTNSLVRDLTMTAEQLHNAAMQGDEIWAPEVGILVPACLRRNGDRFQMWGITGTHSLAVNVTDAARLFAHWTGFKQLAAARAKQQGYGS